MGDYQPINKELVEVDLHKLTIDSPAPDRMWHEAALKKKPKPSELSFQELVFSLKTPIKTPIKA